jgi:hypothetical protein
MSSFIAILKITALSVLATLAFGLLLFLYFNLPGPAPRKDMDLAITFSHRYAADLGLDWKVAYIAMLDELGARKLRIPIYWDLAEPEQGMYDFAPIDFMLDEAQLRGAEVMLVVGQRSPRWPECHIPEWVSEEGDGVVREARLTDFLSTVITRYRDREVVTVWQVENEPFVRFFGECPALSRDFFDKELALVRSLDPSRPILVTDSGEFSMWTAAASRGDMFGTTMYRKVHNPAYGYITYPLGPNYYRAKAWFVHLVTGQEDFIVAELQAEPWANGWVANVSVEEQYETMNPELLETYIHYARRVGFSEAYLWGAEWWYWLREVKGESAVWDTAVDIFRESNG